MFIEQDVSCFLTHCRNQMDLSTLVMCYPTRCHIWPESTEALYPLLVRCTEKPPARLILRTQNVNIVVWCVHDDVINWKHFPCYWPFVRGINRSPVNSPHKGQWREALMFLLSTPWINGWVNNRKAGDLGRHRAHYDVTIMSVCCQLYTIRHVKLWNGLNLFRC